MTRFETDRWALFEDGELIGFVDQPTDLMSGIESRKVTIIERDPDGKDRLSRLERLAGVVAQIMRGTVRGRDHSDNELIEQEEALDACIEAGDVPGWPREESEAGGLPFLRNGRG